MYNNIIYINTDFIKLDSLLKFIGEVQTGGQAKLMITGGEVKVNGEVCIQRGKKIYDGDEIDFFGKVYGIKKK